VDDLVQEAYVRPIRAQATGEIAEPCASSSRSGDNRRKPGLVGGLSPDGSTVRDETIPFFLALGIPLYGWWANWLAARG
jgi:hypothetical protein